MITQRGSEGQAKGLFSELEGIDVDSVGNVYVVDIVIFVFKYSDHHSDNLNAF